MKRNITLFYIIRCLIWGRFYVPVVALFYVASQVPLKEFTIIFSTFSVVLLLLEIPSGVITDFIGKRKSLIISRFFYIIHISLIAFYNGFWPFLLASIAAAIGASLTSGATPLYEFKSSINSVADVGLPPKRSSRA